MCGLKQIADPAGIFENDVPEPPKLPPPPQAPKAPDTAPLKKRNGSGGALAVPSGSTLLTGPSGINTAQLNVGASTLLGGG